MGIKSYYSVAFGKIFPKRSAIIETSAWKHHGRWVSYSLLAWHRSAGWKLIKGNLFPWSWQILFSSAASTLPSFHELWTTLSGPVTCNPGGRGSLIFNFPGAGRLDTVAQWLKLPPVMSTSHLGETAIKFGLRLCFRSNSLLICPRNSRWRLKYLSPATHVCDLEFLT